MALQEVILQTRQALQAALSTNYLTVETYPPVEHFQLADDISIVQLPHETAEQVMDCLEPRVLGWPKPFRQSPQLYTFVRTHNVDVSIWDWKPDQTLEQCVALSRLVHPTSIPLSLHAKIKTDSDGKLLELIPLETELRGAWVADREGRDWLTEEDARNLKNLISYLPLSVPTRVSRALWYFEMTARNYFADVRWTLISTGLEALIHTERGHSTHQFKTRTAKLGAYLGMTAFTVDTALSFYDLRSQLSHGQGMGTLSPKELELYRLGEDVLRGILLRSIKDKSLALGCAYCFLQTVPWFRFRPDELYGLVYTNVDDMVEEIKEWLDDPIPKMMIAGELQDGLVFDSAYKKTSGMPLTHRIIPLFAAQKKHRLIFLTKSDQIQHALELPPTQQVVFSWSVNAEEIGAKWEHGTPLPSERFSAAEKMKKAGWPIRFRLDPMIPYPDWKRGYAETIKRINSLSPEMVTLGALRATSYNGLRNAAKANGRDETIFDYLTEEKDPSGFKYRIPFETQVELFRFAVDRLKSSIKPALCKEDRALWKALGMKFDGCHCLLGRNDAIVKNRNVEMKNAREIEHVIGIGKPLPVLA